MKRNLFPLFMFFSILFITSCGDNRDSLSSGTIEDLCEDKLEEMKADQHYVTLDTGYYELNDLTARQNLQKLRAAGVINYKVVRYAWYNKETYTKTVYAGTRPEYFYGYYIGSHDVYKEKTVTEYNLEEHFLVRVSLTEEGRKSLVDSIPQREEEKDKDIKPLEVKLADYPENNVDLEEHWPELTYPGKPKASAKKSTNKHSSQSTQIEDETKYIGVHSIDKAMVAKYKAELKRFKDGMAYLKAFTIDIKKARKIRLFNGQEGAYATAEVIAKIDDVTPFGRILRGVYEDSRFTFPTSLIYYEDRGWELINDIDFDKASEPVIKIVDPKKKKCNVSDVDDVEDEDMIDTVAVDTVVSD